MRRFTERDFARMEAENEKQEREISRLRSIIKLAAQDLSLIVAKTACGKDRTAIRMTRYLRAEEKKISGER